MRKTASCAATKILVGDLLEEDIAFRPCVGRGVTGEQVHVSTSGLSFDTRHQLDFARF